MKILELFNDTSENFGTDFMSSFKQTAAGSGAPADKAASATKSGPFATANPKLLKQALSNIINGQPLDSAQMQMFKKAHSQL
jgi:hypothetical protein